MNNHSSCLKTRGGFTLIELLIYSAIFGVVSTVLIYFLAIFFRGTGTHATTAEIGNQANFVLQKIEQHIAQASFMVVNDDGNDEKDSAPPGQPHTTLIIKDRAETTGPPNDTVSPIIIYRNPASGAVVIKQGNQPEVALTTKSVKATALQFTKISTPPGRDVVLIDLTLQYQSADPQQQISRQFLLGVGKANAATFDTVLNPNANNALDIGTTGTQWKTLFLSGDANISGKVTWTSAGSNNSIAFLKQGMTNIDPPSMSAGASATVTALIPGILSGDRVLITPPAGLEDGLMMVGATANTDALSIRLRNISASAINGAALNWSYLIIR